MDVQNNIFNRYPGLKSFDEGESHQFFGRKLETTELLNNILTEQLMVLFSKSGVGKSSLLNAGIIPQLKQRGYYPLKIRFQLSNNADNLTEITPLTILKANLRNEELNIQGDVLFQEDKILYNKETPNLWEYIKAMKFPEDQTPVLIFDQFEEFFSYSDKMQHEFLKQMAELLHAQPPNRIINWMGSINLENRTAEQIAWIKQPQVKFVIAIRDDRLSELDSFKTFIPLILKNRYKLNPLSLKNAQEAIEGPAAMADSPSFRARKFLFDKVVVQKILDKLLGLKNAGEGVVKNPGIDGSQLQKVCSFIERKVIEAQKLTTETIVVDDHFLDVERDVQLIIDNFYTEQINLFFTGAEVEMVKDIIEGHFVVEQSRVFVLASQLRAWVNHDTQLIQRMLNARLIKEEHIHLGKGYELSHDTLVPSVIKSKAEKDRKLEEEKNRLEWELKQKELEKIARIEKKRKRLVFYFSLVLILSISIFGLILFNNKQKERKKDRINLSKIYKYEARIQYDNGNLIYSAFLAKLVSVYNSGDTSLNPIIRKELIFPFSGEKIGISKNEKFIGTLWKNRRLNIWSVENGATVNSILDKDDIVTFSFLGKGNLIGTITESNELFFYKLKNKQSVQIPAPWLQKLKKNGLFIDMSMDSSNGLIQIIQQDTSKMTMTYLAYPGLNIMKELTASVDSMLSGHSYEDYFVEFVFTHTFFKKNLDGENILLKNRNGKYYRINKLTGLVTESRFSNFLAGNNWVANGQVSGQAATISKGTLWVFDLQKDSLVCEIKMPPAYSDEVRIEFIFGDKNLLMSDKNLLMGNNVIFNIAERTFIDSLSVFLAVDNEVLVCLDKSGALTVYNNQTGQTKCTLSGVSKYYINEYNEMKVGYMNGRDSTINLIDQEVPKVIPNNYVLKKVIGKKYYWFFDKNSSREIITYQERLKPSLGFLFKNFKPFIQQELKNITEEDDGKLINKIIIENMIK